jgi:hypothetical protein
MPLFGLLTRIVIVPRTGDPEGISPNHFIPLLTRRRLFGDEVSAVATELMPTGYTPVERTDVRVAITGCPVTDPLGLLG